MLSPRFSSVVLILVFAFYCVLPNLFAFGGAPGGPFSNGSYFPNEGTFSAVVRGENLSGVLQFSTTGGSGPVPESGQEVVGNFQPYDTELNAIGGLGSTGVAMIYYDGDSLAGNSQGAFDPAASSMVINFQASVAGQGQQDVSVQNPVTNFVYVDGTDTQDPPQRYLVPDTVTFQPTQRYLYFDSVLLSGFAECQTTDAFPNQKFSGTGEAELQFLDFSSGAPIMVAQTLSLSVTGVRLSNVASAFATRNVIPPSVNSLSILNQ